MCAFHWAFTARTCSSASFGSNPCLEMLPHNATSSSVLLTSYSVRVQEAYIEWIKIPPDDLPSYASVRLKSSLRRTPIIDLSDKAAPPLGFSAALRASSRV
jgi:hypothetical protein